MLTCPYCLSHAECCCRPTYDSLRFGGGRVGRRWGSSWSRSWHGCSAEASSPQLRPIADSEGVRWARRGVLSFCMGTTLCTCSREPAAYGCKTPAKVWRDGEISCLWLYKAAVRGASLTSLDKPDLVSVAVTHQQTPPEVRAGRRASCGLPVTQQLQLPRSHARRRLSTSQG